MAEWEPTRFIRQLSPTWSILWSISNSKIVRSSYVWFVLVPVIARILNNIERILTFQILNEKITITMELPFYWQLFFFAATFFSLANLVYIFRCPDILKKYQAFSDFQKEGQTSFQLIEIYMKLIVSRMKSEGGKYQAVKSLQEFYRSYCTEDQSIKDELIKDDCNILKTISKMNIIEGKLSGAFMHVRNFGEKLHKKSIWLCIALYGIGIAFFLIVFIQNIWTVLKISL
ncbi:hypothetical protein [Lutimonas sp.]|uniref:hypothetical protein n=1 Tax=Lutimonas sp. TaxID=1872403 RepID=UPI003C72772C